MKRTDDKETLAYLKQFDVKKEQYKKDISEWSDEELTEHYKELDKYYGQSEQNNHLLGIFEDKSRRYYWHVIDENKPQILEKRQAIGWTFSHRGDELGLKRSKDPSRMGDSTVTWKVGGGKEAVLLEIPSRLYDLNQTVKAQKSKNAALFDENGKPLRIKTTTKGDVIINHIDGGVIEAG